MTNTMKIKLNNIISPCEFYFQFLDGNLKKQQDDARNQVARIEKRIFNEVNKNNPLKDVENGKIVTFHVKNWSKWVRAKVLNRYQNGEYEVFLIDYGFKFDVKKLYALPEKLTEDYHLVKKGSLALKPVEFWNDSVMTACKALSNKQYSELRFIFNYQQGDLYIGDIFVFTPKGNYSLTEKLKSCSDEVSSEVNFNKIYEILTQASNPKPTLPHTRLEMTKELDLASISNILFHQNNFIQPANLIIHGEGLKAAWKSFEKCPFDSYIKKQLGSGKLTDIQSNMWPQMHVGYRHSVIISNHPNALVYVPVLVNNVMKSPSNRARPEFMGPIAIIIAHSSSKAIEVARMCQNFGRNLKIITAVGICDEQKGEVINGCDILVTTLPALARLTDSISLRIIDLNRLKFVTFDSFHLISSRYESEVNRFMKFCLSDEEKVPQIVVTSGLFTPEVRNKVINQLPKDETVVCIDAFIEAAVFAGIEIKLMICKNFDEKLEEVQKNLKDSLIYVNDDKDAEKLKDILPNDVKIATDSSNEGSNDFESLIHFSPAKNWKIFTKRFSSMSRKILEKLQGNDVKLSSIVLFEEREVAEFEALMTFMVHRKLFKGDLGMLEKIRQSRESIKCNKNVKLCQKLLLFGECMDQYCPDRHVSSQIDNYFNKFTNCYIKFDLIATLSPIDFIIKVREFCKNGKWMSLKDEMKKVEGKLGEDLKNYCESGGENLKVGQGKIGEIYAKLDANEKRWVRGKIIERSSPTIVKLYLIDTCTFSHALESQLIKLPSDLSSLPPLMHKLHIIDLIPLDGDSSYSSHAFEVLKSHIGNFVQNSTFTSKVQMAFNDTLFASEIEAKNASNEIKFRLKKTHIDKGLSDVDESVEKKLRNIFIQHEKAQEEIKVQARILKTPKDEQKATVEMWKELKFGKIFSVDFAHYNSPFSFFVTLESSENFVLKKWMKKIEEFKDLKALESPAVGSSCLIVRDTNKRAKILSIDGDDAELLLVDFGEIISEKISSIYELPDEFKQFRYQVVHCSIFGIRPKFNMNFWPSMQKSVIHKLMKDREWSLKVIGKNLKQHEFCDFNLPSYEVRLVDDEGKYLDHIAVEKFYASATEKIEEIEENSESDESDETNVVESGYSTYESEDSTMEVPKITLQDLEKFMKMCQDEEQKETKKIEIEPKIQQEVKPSLLNNLYKHPYIEWRQNDICIYLVITAKDCLKYSISLTEFSVDVGIIYDTKSERAILQLYGLIDPKLSSHKLSGGNIILRLGKRGICNEWPRLTDDKTFANFIKFSDENVPYIPTSESSTSTGKVQHYLPPGLSDEEEEEDSDVEGSKCISDDD